MLPAVGGDHPKTGASRRGAAPPLGSVLVAPVPADERGPQHPRHERAALADAYCSTSARGIQDLVVLVRRFSLWAPGGLVPMRPAWMLASAARNWRYSAWKPTA